MSEDRRRKAKPEDFTLIAQPAFERELGILFQVPKAEVDAVEAKRFKRSSGKRHEGAA